MSDFEDFTWLATFRQTIPTVAVLALLIPFRLWIQTGSFSLVYLWILPVLRNTIGN